MAWFGWRAVFIAFGCASLLWLWPWLATPRAVVPRRSPGLAAETPGAPSTATVLRRRELWGMCLAQFCGTYALSAGTSVLTGWASDRWRRAGAPTNRVRKSGLVAGLAMVTVCLIACAQASSVGALLAMGGCGVGIGIWTPALFATAQTLAGPHATGRWMGIQNCLGNLAGMTAPVVTGVVVDRTGHFAFAFGIAAVLAVVGILAVSFVVRRIEPIDWRRAELTRLVPALPPQG